jgi:NADH-quinone oxidoreductase subunit L
MRRMGNLRKYMPITFVTMMAGWLAICGIPIWAGFFSKDEILYRTFAASGLPANWNYILWIVGLLTAVLTACYMTRLMVMTFFGSERFHEALPDAAHAHDPAHAEENAFATGDAHDGDTHSAHHEHEVHDSHDDDHDDEHHDLPHDFKPHESPWTMTLPLVVLAILSTVGGLVGIPYAVSSMFGGGDVNVFERVLEPVIWHGSKAHEPTKADHGEVAKNAQHAESAVSPKAAEHAPAAEHAEHNPEEISTERKLAGLSVVLAITGIAIGFGMFKSNPLRKLPRILEDKWRIDELYNGYIVDPITRLSREGLWKGFDVGFIDGIVNGIGHFVMEAGNLVRGLQVGFVRSYAAIILLGALAVLGYFIYYGWKLVV